MSFTWRIAAYAKRWRSWLVAQDQLLIAFKAPAEALSRKYEAYVRVRRFLAKAFEEPGPNPSCIGGLSRGPPRFSQ
jgi:hypothetical protein